MRDGFLFYHLNAQDADWLPVKATELIADWKIPVGSCVCMSRHMVEATRAFVKAGGVKSLKQGVLLGDFSWKCCYSGYAMGLWAQASMHSYSAGSSSQHLPKIESIPMAHQWNPKESIQTVALGLITMISVYKNVWDIDLSKWFSAVILDDHAAEQASIEIIHASWSALGAPGAGYWKQNLWGRCDTIKTRRASAETSKTTMHWQTTPDRCTPSVNIRHTQSERCTRGVNICRMHSGQHILQTRRAGWTAFNRSVASVHPGRLCESKSTICVIVLPHSCSGVNFHRDNHWDGDDIGS